MASELDKWAKRHCYPVDLGDGVNGYVKPMKFSDMDALSKVENDITSAERTQWYLACCTCDETSATLIPERGQDESGADFLKRAKEVFGEWETTTVSKAMEAIVKVCNPTKLDDLVKN